MEPELQRILIRVGIGGTVVMLIAGGALIVAFRSLGSEQGKKSRDFRAAVLIAGVLAFVMICCLVLFRIAMIR